MTAPSKRRLGEILVERGFVSPEQLREALRAQYQEGKRLGEILVEMGALGSDELNWALSEALGIPYVEFREEMVDLALARTLPEEILRRHEAFPVLRVGDELTVILTDPTNQHAVVDLEAVTGAKVSIAIASRETILHLLDRAFPPAPGKPPGVRYAEVGAGQVPPESDPTGVAQVYALLLGALREDATEVHVEPLVDEVRVRNRVDGRLIDRARLPRALLSPVVSRFRILAGLRGESLPHESHVRTRLEQQEVELELLFFPTIYGEAVTVKISQRRTGPPTLDAFDLEGTTRDTLVRLAGGTGLVFVTGWDPRARASLLYAMAQMAAAPTKKVVTLERAVSYVVAGFVQVEVPGEFAEGAATILSHPADILLVEDLAANATCLAAIGSAEQGALVLGGLGFGTNATGLGHLLSLDVPRVPLLSATTGLANVHRQGARYRVGVLPMDEELRHELLTRQGPRRGSPDPDQGAGRLRLPPVGGGPADDAAPRGADPRRCARGGGDPRGRGAGGGAGALRLTDRRAGRHPRRGRDRQRLRRPETMDQAPLTLYRAKKITQEAALQLADSPNNLRLRMKGIK